MARLFSDEHVNSGRQVELDLAKCLAIFFMIFLHCSMVSLGFNNEISLFMQRMLGQLLGGPFAAPVFMFAMGVGIVYSRNQDPAYLIKRGIKLMLLGLVVNVGEFILPHYLAGKLLGEWDIFPVAGGLLLFCVDILAFAGMAMILIGVLKKLNLSTRQTVIIAIVLSVLGSFLRFHDFGSNVPNLIAGYFIGSAGGFTAFPLFNWFIFPASGMLFGEYYIRCNDKKKLLRLWPAGLVISVAYFVISWFIPGGFLSETHHYYFMTTIDVVFCLICIYGVIGLCNLVVSFLSDSAAGFFSKMSGDLNAIYVIQWFLIPLTYIFICFFNRDVLFGDLSLVVIALLEIVVSTAAAAGYKKVRKKMNNRRSASSVMLSLLLMMALLFVPFADTAWAEDGAKKSKADVPHRTIKLMSDSSSDEDDKESEVHSDPATFRKNLILSPDQKEYTITEIEKTISRIIKPEMSDLEKYYTLAIWENKHVSYDWQFWSGGYDFDYYSHQWDAYGGMKEDEKSVCVGIAIFYSNLCHAADLPCRFVRTDPKIVDHTINYIPNINGNDYYVDVTENGFLMSGDSSYSFEPYVDRAFAGIPASGCKDKSFDYYDDDDEDYLMSSTIKDFYNVPFDRWYTEYALHKNTTKKFAADYTEKGSGRSGVHYATYHERPSDFVTNPDIWFLDDFYENPAQIKSKILAGEFDKELLNVSGVSKNYDCETTEELEAAVARDISVRYFPSAENGEVVAKADELEKDTDYTVEFDSYDEDTRTAEFTVRATDTGDYHGTYKFDVKMNSAVVSKAPAPKKGLVYNESPHELIEPGQAEGGEMQYALGNKNAPTEEFTTAIPTATDAGKYYVWYKAAGDAGHLSSEPQCMERVVSIAKKQLEMTLKDITLMVGESATIQPKLSVKKLPATYEYESFDTDIATVDENGVVTGIKEGSTAIFVNPSMKYPSTNYEAPDGDLLTVEVKSTSISGKKVTLSKSKYTYNGKVHKPAIKKINGLELTAGKDYSVKWSNASPKNVGVYTVTITGKGKYSGVTKASFRINPKGTKIKSLKRAKKAVIVKWAKQKTKMSKSRITGYQIRLATDKKFTKNKRTVTVKGFKKTVKKIGRLKGGKKYYVKVRTYKIVGGKRYYSAWSKYWTVVPKK